MRVIARRTLREFWQKPSCKDCEQPLKAWLVEAERAEWKTPADIKADYRSASFVANSRVVFNIAGNKYRLVVAVKYEFGIIYIRFIGTHKQYDRIKAVEV